MQQKIVVDLRAQVYEKLERLSFRFFSDHASGTIINRVTSDVQNVRFFVDGVILQAVILILSLGFYLGYMLHSCGPDAGLPGDHARLVDPFGQLPKSCVRPMTATASCSTGCS